MSHQKLDQFRLKRSFFQTAHDFYPSLQHHWLYSWYVGFRSHGGTPCIIHTVDGCEILHQLILGLSHCLKAFNHSVGGARFLPPTVSWGCSIRNHPGHVAWTACRARPTLSKTPGCRQQKFVVTPHPHGKPKISSNRYQISLIHIGDVFFLTEQAFKKIGAPQEKHQPAIFSRGFLSWVYVV